MFEHGNRIGIAAVLAAVLLIVPAVSLRGQETSADTGGDRLSWAALKKFSLDARDTLIAPFHWGGRELLTFGVTAGIAAGLFAGDASIARAIRKIQVPQIAEQLFGHFGNGNFLVAFDAALYLAGAVFDSSAFRTTALVGMESFLTTSAIVLVLKSVVGRARPSARETEASFHPLAMRDRYESFPSGDAAGAFALGTVIAERSDSIVVDIFAYGLAGLAALNRVHDNKHWVSDVFVGSAIGFFVGKKISALNRSRGERPVRVSLVPARMGWGAAVDFVF